MRVGVIACAIFALLPVAAGAQPLTVVEVSAPKINCVFNASCTITVSDTTGNILLPTVAGMKSGSSRFRPWLESFVPPWSGASRSEFRPPGRLCMGRLPWWCRARCSRVA